MIILDFETNTMNSQNVIESAAKKFSKCPFRKSGGDLCTFSKGEMVKELDTIVFKEDLHRVHGPNRTEFGFHLIEILARY